MITKLETVDQVTDALLALIEERHQRNRDGLWRAAKPAQRRAEASRMADLFEIRMGMWRGLGTAARQNDAIPDAYASACAIAEARDFDSVKFWRREAGAR